jgi:ABC-type nickel/cobalt efflux system permease component RcnA
VTGHARLRLVPIAAVMAATLIVAAGTPVSAHPLGNFTVNRAIAIRVAEAIEVTAILDLAEIPAYEVIRELDADDDDAVSDEEGRAYAERACAHWRDAIYVDVDGAASPLGDRGDQPRLTFPAGAGGLPTLRLECGFAVEGVAPAVRHELELTDRTTDVRAGWREVTARAVDGAVLEASDVPTISSSALLTAYPEDALEAPPDIRTVRVSLRLADGSAAPASAPSSSSSGPAIRGTADDPLAALIGGTLSPGLVLLAIAMSVGLGAAHALSPGHGKTLVAAYVLGAGGSARSALQIGLWVAIAHTAGVFVLGTVTLVASRYLLPERLIDWLSLTSGVIVTGLGLVLLWRLARKRGGAEHGHAHDHPHPHSHPHGHSHGHGGAPTGELTWRGAVALGFAGGAVPSASALIVLLVALATDRLAFGVLLIACFGIGMAAVLGGLALAVARVRSFASDRSRWPMRVLTDHLARLGPIAAGLVVLATGLAFTAAAASRLT